MALFIRIRTKHWRRWELGGPGVRGCGSGGHGGNPTSADPIIVVHRCYGLIFYIVYTFCRLLFCQYLIKLTSVLGIFFSEVRKYWYLYHFILIPNPIILANYGTFFLCHITCYRCIYVNLLHILLKSTKYEIKVSIWCLK